MSTVLGGFLRDDTTGALNTVAFASAVAPTSVREGFLRDANYALVTGSTAPLGMAAGFVRDVNYSLVTVDYASAVAPMSVSQGFLRDANGAFVTIASGSAAAPTGYADGFLRDKNYAIVLAGAAATYDSTILADSPVAFWKLNETSGTVAADATGHGHTGTYTGTFTLGVAGPTSDGESGVSLPGVDGDYVLCGTSAILAGSANLSIEAFIKTTANGGANGMTIYAERNASTGNDILKLEEANASGTTLQLTYRDDAGTLNQIHSTTAINSGAWTHVVVTKSGTSIVLYINGAQDATGTLTATNTFTNVLRCQIGDDPTGSTAWNGSLAKVALYNVALTGTQVSNHYAAR